MTDYEFAGATFNSLGAMLDAIAFENMTAGGLNPPEWVDTACKRDTPEYSADEAIQGWGLDQSPDGEVPSHMEQHGYTRDDLVQAHREFYETRPDRVEDEE